MIKDLQKMVTNVIENRTVAAVLSVLVSLYVVFAAPEIPDVVRNLFDNAVFRFVVIFLVAYYAHSSKNPMVALVVTVAFLFVTNILSGNRLIDSYSNYKRYENFEEHSGEEDEEAEEEDDEEEADVEADEEEVEEEAEEEYANYRDRRNYE